MRLETSPTYFMMMEGRISLDHINTQPQYNLVNLCTTETDDDTITETSPYDMITNTCEYYCIDDVRNKLMKDENSISIFSLNCQGLRSHWDEFSSLVSCNNSSSLFDIIGITELYGMSDGECALEGYHPLVYKTRNDTDRSRGGVGLYVKNNISYKVRNDLSIFIPHILETIFIEIKHKNRNIIVGTIYRPNTPQELGQPVCLFTF